MTIMDQDKITDGQHISIRFDENDYKLEKNVEDHRIDNSQNTKNRHFFNKLC